MKRFLILCWLAAGSVTALILFQVKQEVHTLEQELTVTHREILRDQEAVHILQAEWSYLNSPARLAALAERHLGMAAIPAERVIGFNDLPLPGAPGDGDTPDNKAPDERAQPTLVKAPAGVLRP
jgi:hypothetical protein